MQTPFVTYRFLYIDKLDMKSPVFPVHKDRDYIGEHVKGTLDKRILDICEIKCDDMKLSFNDCLFVFRTGVPVRYEHTPNSMYIPKDDFVNIYVMMDMDVHKKEVYMDTMFDAFMKEKNKRWKLLGMSDKQRRASVEVCFNSEAKRQYAFWTYRGPKYDPRSWLLEVERLVAEQEGVRRACIPELSDEFMRQKW